MTSMTDQQRIGSRGAVVAETSILLASLARVRRRCRVLNDAYQAAENKPEVRLRILEAVRRLRKLHALLPPRLRKKSWILTLEFYNSWILETKKSA